MRWFFREKSLHELFDIGIVVKGIDGIIELTSGLVLYFVHPLALNAFLTTLIQGELAEDPKDVLGNYLLHMVNRALFPSKWFITSFLMLHGAVKIFLVIGLLRKKLWAYPTAIVFFIGFITYQLYRLSYRPSLLLGIATLFDMFVVALTFHEYIHAKKRAMTVS